MLEPALLSKNINPSLVLDQPRNSRTRDIFGTGLYSFENEKSGKMSMLKF